MANTGLAFLGSLRIQAQQRADMVNSQFVSTVEWNRYLTASFKELYDLLITSYGDEYYMATPYNFSTVSNQTLYTLPDGLTTVDTETSLVAAPFYKLFGLELKVTASPDSWVTLRNFTFTERNKYQLTNLYIARGVLAYLYRVVGSNLWLTPIPVGSQNVQMWYAPKPTNLMAEVSCGTTSSSATITTSDTSQLAVGMSVADLVLPQGATQIIPTGATIASIVTNTSFAIAGGTAGATATGYLLGCWSDSTTLDGISGWEEYVVIDAAMKACIKEESSTAQELMAEKMAMKERIQSTAADRDAGLPSRVTDSTSIDLGRGDGWGGIGGGGEW